MQIREKLEKAYAEQCRRRFATFVMHAFRNALEPGTKLDWGRHLDAICDHVQWVVEVWAMRRTQPELEAIVQNLLINIPPRSLKSKIVSICLPAWAWLRHPDMTFFGLGVPHTSHDNSRACLELVQSSWYKRWFAPKWRIDEDHCAASDFGLCEDDGQGGKRTLGWRKGAGWMTGITGQGADCLLPDDPHDAEEVHSDEKRANVLNKWDMATWNRVRDLRVSIRIAIMQRLREDDFAGHVLAKAKADPLSPQWVHLKIPLRFRRSKACTTPMPVDAQGRYAVDGKATWLDWRTEDGECMDPVRFPPHVVEAELKRLGPYGFSGQYDQDPEPIGGGIFRRQYWGFFRFEGVTPGPFERPEGCRKTGAKVIKKRHRSDEWDFDQVAISVDASFRKADEEKKGQRSEVGLGVVGIKGADRFVIRDETRGLGYLEAKDAIRDLAKRYPYAKWKLIEGKANGDAIVEDLKSELQGLVVIDPGQDSKEARAFACEPEIAAGNVYLLEGEPWLDAFVSQWAGFPLMKRNDRVDMLVQVLIHFGVKSAAAKWRALAQR